MYVHSVKLINFKSIGEDENSEIILEPRITAIIGKNESGKSNILDGLSRISFHEENRSAFLPELANRNNTIGKDNKYIIALKPSDNDIKRGIVKDTWVEIEKNQCKTTGGLVEYYLEEVYKDYEAVIAILESIGTNPFQLKDQELVKFRKHKKSLQTTEYIDIPSQNYALGFFQSQTGKIAVEKRAEFTKVLEIAIDKWFLLKNAFPVFFFRSADKHLNTSYKLEEIDKELKKPLSVSNSLLYDLVKLIGVSPEEFLLAAQSGTKPVQETARQRINRLVNQKINREFHDFYQTEEISLYISFNSGGVSFMVQSADGEALMLSERSNGLRWYLETFIDARANDISEQNVVYLLDEPGVSLHVNAQRELIQLFKHLSEKGNQVVYTTHSPYMLDLEEEGIHRIRAVVKNSEGITKIYKTAYDARISPDSQQDTLAPIISAIGMNLYDTFGPAETKINIVTEGISDIIPSVGATNCVHICCILQGWGCKYIALFDFDKEGVEKGGEFLREEMYLEMNKQYCYVRAVSQVEIDKKIYKSNSYMIEDLILRTEIERFCDFAQISKTLGKPLIAKMMCTAIENGTFIPSDESVNNFKQLFSRVFSCIE